MTFLFNKSARWLLAALLPLAMFSCKKDEIRSREMLVFLQPDQAGIPTQTQTLSFLHTPADVRGERTTELRAIQIGLVDRIGGINDAVVSAAGMAGLEKFSIAIYPEPKNFFEQLFAPKEPLNYLDQLRTELGPEYFQVVEQVRQLRTWTGVQTRWPFVPASPSNHWYSH